MALKGYVKSSNNGDKLATGDHLNVPFYIQPLELFTGLKTKFDEEGTEVVLRAHAYNLNTDEVYANIVLFNGALVDGLGRYVGDETVVRFVDVQNKAKTGTYRAVAEGTTDDFAVAEKKLETIQAAIAARVAELDSNAAVADGPAQDSGQASAVKAAFKRN
jgi:hypothetical protein